jgi:hypothetical protein
VEILHRENPVLALYWPCKGLQCGHPITMTVVVKVIGANSV